MKRSASVIVLALCLIAAHAQEAAQDWFWGKPIASIEWAGVQHADSKALDATVKPYIGKAFSEDLWSELQSRVYGLDFFESIEPAAYPADSAKTKVLIKFTVKEYPSISAISISGNSGLRTTEILDVVKEKSGDIYNAAKARGDELAIKALYLEKGYPDAVVSSRSDKTASGVGLVFLVVEGTQLSIKEIHFSGNSVFKEKALAGLLELKPKGFLRDGAFQEAKLETDKQKIVYYYTSRGYVDARVDDVLKTVVKDPKDKKSYLVLTFAITEGEKWNFGGVSIEGNKVFDTAKLMSYFKMKPGDLLDSPRLAQQKQALDDLYYENGYIFNTIKMAESRDGAQKSIAYTISIVERDRAHIESISFKGNTRTRDYVIAREIPLEVGDIFSKAKIIEGLRNLYNLQYFSAIEPQMLPGSDENLMGLVISVEEQNTAEVQFGFTISGVGSASTTFPLSGIIKWSEKNFMGTGQNVGVELNASSTDQTVTLSYLDNWLFGKRISGGVNFSFNHQSLTTTQDIAGPTFDDITVPDPYTSREEYTASSSSILAADKMPYTYWALSFGLTGGYTMHTPAGDLGLVTGASSTLSRDEYDTTLYRPASKDIRAISNQWLWTNKIPLRASLNNLDLWYNPSTGYYASQKLTWAGLVPTDIEAQHYLRSDTRVDAYCTLFNLPVAKDWNFKWILGGHSALSAIAPQPFGPYSKNAVVLPSDDLRIDGTFIGRGWSILSDSDNGRLLWDNWLELRMPIFEQYLWIDGFLDVDALKTDSGFLSVNSSGIATGDSSFGWDNLIMSLGFGIRITMPQFPFRFYFAKPFSFNGSTFNFSNPAGLGSDLKFVVSISQSLN
jgi:outer membrane protein insertion porin family